MAAIVRTKEGSWRVPVRRKGKYASQTFRLKSLASEWAVGCFCEANNPHCQMLIVASVRIR